MYKSTLPQRLIKLKSFQIEFEKLLIESVKGIIILPNTITENEIDLNYLLECASILYQSESAECLDAALRIAQFTLSLSNSNRVQKTGAITILEGLTNKPAINLAIKRQLINGDYFDDLPFPLQLEILKRDLQHGMVGKNDSIKFLNRFQKKVYDAYNTSDLVTISAPTSAGKSYVLSQLILEEVQKGSALSFVYIVPTRALISQVEEDFRGLIKEYSLTNLTVTSVPQIGSSLGLRSTVYVFTQERLHYFRVQYPKAQIHFLIVDEAQKIEDGARGMLLQQKIEETVHDFPEVKIFFSSPFTENPEKLLSIVNRENAEVIKTEFVAVNQNLFYITFISSKKIRVSYVTKENSYDLGQIEFPARTTSIRKKFMFAVKYLANGSEGNIIYANGPAEAESLSVYLHSYLGPDYDSSDEDIKNLIALVQKIVHKDYLLAFSLTRKVAFHYGNMPLIIRQEIERLFKIGKIHFLVCTSTLLEGVNLPAKSIFIRNPTRGRNTPLTQNDFWNLAGRAGRMGKEFEGNIFCIEPEVWAIPPTPEKRKQNIHVALDETLTHSINQLIQYINDLSPRAEVNRKQDLEYAFSYLFLKLKQGQLKEVLEVRNIDYVMVANVLKESIARYTVPLEIIIKNPGISPLAIQALYNYLETQLDNIQSYIPVYPEQQNASTHYWPIVERIAEMLSGDPKQLAYYHSILVINWMNGYSLARIIQNSLDYWKKRDSPKNTATIIRETMKDIEEFVRFKFAKFSSCYVDVLKHLLLVKERNELLEEIPDLGIWIEFGVSQQTQISFISLGLSRNTAIELADYIESDAMTKDEAIQWLQRNDISKLPMSPITLSEIQRVTELHST